MHEVLGGALAIALAAHSVYACASGHHSQFWKQWDEGRPRRLGRRRVERQSIFPTTPQRVSVSQEAPHPVEKLFIDLFTRS